MAKQFYKKGGYSSFGDLDRFLRPDFLAFAALFILAMRGLFSKPVINYDASALDGISVNSDNLSKNPAFYLQAANDIQTACQAFNIGGTDTNMIWSILNPLNCDEINAVRLAFGTRPYKPWPWSSSIMVNLDSLLHQEVSDSSATGKLIFSKLLTCQA